jgi:hypothetical protein
MTTTNENAQANPEANSTVVNTEQAVAEKLFPEGGDKAVVKAEPVVEKVVDKVDDKISDAAKADLEIKIGLPEKTYLDAKDLEDIQALAKEHGLTNKQTQALLIKQSEKMDSFVNTQIENFKAKIAGYESAIKTDKELGGEKYNQSVSLAQRVVEKYGNESLRNEFNQSGFGSHPEVIRMLSRIGRQMGDDQLISPNAKPSTTRSAEEIIYGKQK